MNSKSVRKNVPRWTDWRAKPPTKPKGRFYSWLAVRERPGGTGPASRPVLRPPGGGGERLRGCGARGAVAPPPIPRRRVQLSGLGHGDWIGRRRRCTHGAEAGARRGGGGRARGRAESRGCRSL